MQAGTKYLKIGFIQFLTFRPLPALASSMKLSQPQPSFQQQNTEKKKAPSGRRLVQVSRGSADEYQAEERAGVEMLSWRVSGR